MRKMFAVMKREYLQAVRRKMFIVMTLLFPLLMTGMMVIPAMIAARGIGDKRVVIIDGTGRLKAAFDKVNVDNEPKEKNAAREMMKRRQGPDMQARFRIVEYRDASNESRLETVIPSYLQRLITDDAQKLDAIFVIPRDAQTNEDAQFRLYSATAADIFTEERLSRVANRGLQQSRIAEKGIDAATLEKLMHDLDVDNIQLSRSGEQKEGGGSTLILAFVFGALLLLPAFIYGNEIMRGIVQEKSERVVEVLLSSMTPMNLLSGKIIGIAAVGLTQVAVWLSMIGFAGFKAATFAKGLNFGQFLRPSIFLFFVLFFVLAYLTYVCIYAIAGAVSNSDREAQQFIAPISVLMMMPWILMFPIVTNPESPLAVGFSFAPVWGPFSMFVRTLVAEPPVWHIVASVAISLVTILVFLWITAKIFRVGILSYGKRPTMAELWRWIKVA